MDHRLCQHGSEKLGIEVYRVHAGVDKGLLEENMFISHMITDGVQVEKIASVVVIVAKISEGNTLIITGDCDGEPRRSLRSPIRLFGKNTIMLTPIKLWGGTHVQLYILKEGIKT